MKKSRIVIDNLQKVEKGPISKKDLAITQQSLRDIVGLRHKESYK